MHPLVKWTALWPQRRNQHTVQTGELLTTYASQGGQAQLLAERSCAHSLASGMPARCITLNQLGSAQLATLDRLLLVVSIYGDGKAPNNAAQQRLQQLSRQPHTPLTNDQVLSEALGTRHQPRPARIKTA